MKKVLIMGGGDNQLPIIIAAQELGYRIILCDSKKLIPGKKYAHRFYQCDISDFNIMCKIIEAEKVDGVVSNTESLMELVAKLQTKYNFIGNTSASIKKLNDKYLFRKIQEKAGVFFPKVYRTNEFIDAKEYVNKCSCKMVLKPEKSSGSRGTYIISSPDDLTESIFEQSVKCSRNANVLIEEYVEMSSACGIEGEIFLFDGNIEQSCWFKVLRDRKRGTIPNCYCSISEISSKQIKKIDIQLMKIFSEAAILWGEYNVEIYYNQKGELFIVEINVRQGGMRLPNFVNSFMHVDLNKLLVSTAINDLSYYYIIKTSSKCNIEKMLHYRVLTDKIGVLQEVIVDEKIEKYLIEKYDYIYPEMKIEKNSSGMNTICLLDFKFDTRERLNYFMEKIFDMITVSMK